MGRIRDAAVLAGRTAYRLPMPSAVYTNGLREARRALPPGRVQKSHAVDLQMIGRTRCVWLDRHHADRGVLVHLHGGAFVSGPFTGDWEWLSAQADAQECAALMIDYRAAPDHVHPVALDDTGAVLTVLAEQGILRPGGWVLTGQNAGGGLALTIARRIVAGELPVPAPAGLVLMSPWLDLSLETTGISETGGHDPVHERRMLEAAARQYAGRTPREDPDLSPLNAHLAGLPPIHLAVGTRDIFVTDVRVARLQLEEQGIEVRYREVSGRIGALVRLRRGEDMKRLLREQAAFVREALGTGA
ncbi:alpha/beta hydrolase fold domain-containing protein [Brachybacterium sp. AOP25-B2-12]|uniref:alpha/beta hydrolase fold domain-containing protein n=1 Tax=Brachybacterium sp. AOP25-B2-12 TaxID=3457710 RepID=UPI0040343564